MFGFGINTKCIQKFDPSEHEFCHNGEDCTKCGWNVDVHNDRVYQYNENGLTLCPDGLRRLIIR